MTKHERNVWLVGFAVIAVLAGGWFARDSWLRSGREFDCGDGPRRRIDLRDFTLQYSAYSAQFEGEIQGKGRISAKLEPSQLQQLTEAVQQAAEFRKFVIAGYNACALTRDQYGKFGSLFQDLDALERRIAGFSEKPAIAPEDRKQLEQLITEFTAVSGKLRQ